jgi:hypothetical protein
MDYDNTDACFETELILVQDALQSLLPPLKDAPQVKNQGRRLG